jgi:hypothetical protein
VKSFRPGESSVDVTGPGRPATRGLADAAIERLDPPILQEKHVKPICFSGGILGLVLTPNRASALAGILGAC